MASSDSSSGSSCTSSNNNNGAPVDDQSLDLTLGNDCSNNIPSNNIPSNISPVIFPILSAPPVNNNNGIFPPQPAIIFPTPFQPSAPQPGVSYFLLSPSQCRQNPSLHSLPPELKEPPEDDTTTAQPVINKPHQQRRSLSRVRPASMNLANGKSETITPPFPWATNKRCHFYPLQHILNQTTITTITGDLHCKKCDAIFSLKFDLESKFCELASFVAKNKDKLRHRAPKKWKNPILPCCEKCKKRNAVKPVMSPKKKTINWLFLFLGEMLGCCNLKELKYFCKHTGIHRTAAKDRLIFLVYLNICKQLHPTGPFDL